MKNQGLTVKGRYVLSFYCVSSWKMQWISQVVCVETGREIGFCTARACQLDQDWTLQCIFSTVSRST